MVNSNKNSIVSNSIATERNGIASNKNSIVSNSIATERNGIDDPPEVFVEGRNFLDGVFDLFHSGHVNILLSGKELSKELVVGVAGDDVKEYKGLETIYTLAERMRILKAMKCVDDVVETEYVWAMDLIHDNKIHNCMHGSDIPDFIVYKKMKDVGRFITLPRTRGISTSALIYRLLDAALISAREKTLASGFVQHNSSSSTEDSSDQQTVSIRNSQLIEYIRQQGMRDADDADWGRLPQNPQQSLVNLQRLRQVDRRVRKDTDTVVYIDGCFDIIHPGHLDLLAKAREMGSYVIVGLFDDRLIQQVRGDHLPILSMVERAIALTGFEYVDDVLFGVPWMLEPAFLDIVRPNIIIKREEMLLDDFLIPIRSKLNWESDNPYEHVDSSIEVVTVPMNMTVEDLMSRVLSQKDAILKFIDKRVLSNKHV